MRCPASKCGLFAVRLPNQIHPGTNDNGTRSNAQNSGRWFARSRVSNLGFEIVDREIQFVNEDRRIFVGVRIVGRILHTSTTQSLRWARTITRRYSSGERPLLLASAARLFMAGFNRIPSTALIFAKAGVAQDEARFAAVFGRALLLWHVRNLPHIFLFAMPSRCSQGQR